MNNIRPYRSACAYIRSDASGPRLHAELLQQSRRINAFTATSLHVLTRTVVEQAADGQPELNRLLNEATSPERPFDLLIVSSENQLSRDPATLRQVRGRLSSAGVNLVVLVAMQSPAIAPMAAETL